MIIDERMVTYINSLDTGHTPFLENLERTAKQTKVPIIRREMQSFLKVFLKMKQPKRILEVGTAVGFSAVFMAQYGEPDAEITTIENYEKADLTDLRKRQYSFYSNYSHNDFLSFLFFSFSSPKNEKDKLFNNVWGGYISRVNTILENMISFLWYTSKAFMKLLVDKDIHISKETLRTEEELWKFSIYTVILLDRYYFDYFMNKNSK